MKTDKWILRIVAAVMIALGLGWVLFVRDFVLFMSVFGDCFENCDGYFGSWAVTARFYNFEVLLGEAIFIVGIAALAFRLAQVALAAIAATMLLVLLLDGPLNLPSIWIPVVDVPVGHFFGPILILIPSAALWLGGTMVGIFGPRLFGLTKT